MNLGKKKPEKLHWRHRKQRRRGNGARENGNWKKGKSTELSNVGPVEHIDLYICSISLVCTKDLEVCALYLHFHQIIFCRKNRYLNLSISVLVSTTKLCRVFKNTNRVEILSINAGKVRWPMKKKVKTLNTSFHANQSQSKVEVKAKLHWVLSTSCLLYLFYAAIISLLGVVHILRNHG